MNIRKALVSCLLLIAVGSWTVTGTAQSNLGDTNNTGGSLAEPLPGEQEWTKDIAMVTFANAVLIKYAGLPPKAQTRLAPAIYPIAKLRRIALGRLISSDPRQALLLSLSPADRQGLPKFAMELLENRIHATGDLIQTIEETIQASGQDMPLPGPTDNPTLTDNPNTQDIPAPETRTYWRVRIGQTHYRATVYGIRLQHQTKNDTPIHGIALDDQMAISESPLYQYDPFETWQLGFNPGEIVATSGGFPIPLTDVTKLIGLEQQLVDELRQYGPRPFPFDPYAWSRGQKDILVIKVSFPDMEGTTPHSDGEIIGAFLGADLFFRDNSREQTWLAPLIHPEPLVLQASDTYRAAFGIDQLEDDALEAAEDAGLNPYDYDRIVIMAPQIQGAPTFDAGSWAGGSVVRLAGRSDQLFRTLTYELGHTYGFPHSAMWLVSSDSSDPIGDGVYEPYLDGWDVMGRPNTETAGLFYQRHFNAFFKAMAGWLPAAAIAEGRTGGTPLTGGRLFALYPHDSRSATGLRAIYIEGADGTTYWVGKRSLFPGNASMASGVEIRRVQTPSEIHGLVELLDVDPPSGAFGNQFIEHSARARFGVQDRVNGITVSGGIEEIDMDGNEFQYVIIQSR